VNYTFLALGVAFFGLSFVFFAQANKATDGKMERTARAAAVLLSVAGVAFIVAGTLHLVTGTGA